MRHAHNDDDRDGDHDVLKMASLQVASKNL